MWVNWSAFPTSTCIVHFLICAGEVNSVLNFVQNTTNHVVDVFTHCQAVHSYIFFCHSTLITLISKVKRFPCVVLRKLLFSSFHHFDFTECSLSNMDIHCCCEIESQLTKVECTHPQTPKLWSINYNRAELLYQFNDIKREL